MKRAFPNEFLFQVVALLVAMILVHTFYVWLIRPKADWIMEEQAALMRADPDYVQERSLWVIVRDFEQEACFILMLWAIAIMAHKSQSATREQRLLGQELVPLSEGTKILPEDVREYARQIQALPDASRHALLPRALSAALHRFGATQNIQNVSTTAHAICEAESERLESELSRAARVRAVDGALHRLGHPVDRLHRHRTWDRRRTGQGAPGGRGQYLRCHA